MSDPQALSWPLSRLAEALELAARKGGLFPRHVDTPLPPEGLLEADGDALGRWVDVVARTLGVEVEAADVSYAEVERFLSSAAPALLRLPGGGEPRFLALLGHRGGAVSVLGPDLVVHRVPVGEVRRWLCRDLEASAAEGIESLIDSAEVPAAPRERVRKAVLRERLALVGVGDCWVLRLPPGGSFWQQVRHARLPGRLAIMTGAHAAQYVLWIVAWWLVGRGALEGRLDRGWLIGWALLLLTLVPFRLLATWSQGQLALGVGKLLKRRLLVGALRLRPEEIRHQGTGQLLGRVIESEAVEALALSAGFTAVVAGIELLLAALVLGSGAGSSLHVLLLVGWVAAAVLVGWRYAHQRLLWTEARRAMTHDLVERMLGQRTRLAQEAPERWHESEDQALERYLALSALLDGMAARLGALLPRGWLILGLLGLAPGFVTGRASAAVLAVSLGGVLLGYEALDKLSRGLADLAGAAIAWRGVAPLFHAAARSEVPGSPVLAVARGPRSSGFAQTHPVLEAHDVSFRYRERGEPLLRSCHLRIAAGERLLLEGPSGGGKSTLASLLNGLRRPESGLLLLHGLDRHTLGSDAWRRLVAVAPQFHENHVFAESFAFNLLMGRRWPPHQEDLEEAEGLCRELGLGDLLDRMPAGMMQLVGETGWQLSHGERSRLFLARALLQRADLVILDESFAALDPENLHRALRCALDRTPTLLVIAHP